MHENFVAVAIKEDCLFGILDFNTSMAIILNRLSISYLKMATEFLY